MLVNLCHTFLIPHPALAAKDSKCAPTCMMYAPLINADPNARCKPDTSVEYHELFWSTCSHILGCVHKTMRHNAILLSALKRVFLDFFGFVSMTTDVAALAMGLGKHADAQVQTDHYSFMAVLSGQKDRNRSLLIDLTIVNTGCTTNVNSTEDMLEQAAERKLQKYGPTAEAAGLDFLPIVFGSDGSFGRHFVQMLLNPWKQRRLSEVRLSDDPWENEWTVHREARQIAFILGCEIARQNGRMVERTLDSQRSHTRDTPYSMRAWRWGEDVDYTLMRSLDTERQEMIASYKASKAVQIAKYRRCSRFSTSA